MKSSEVDPITGERHHLVQGITTAAATWISAAVGVACGGGMYFTAGFSTALNLLLLRFGPRASQSDDSSVTSLFSNPELTNLVGRDIETGRQEQTAEDKPSYGGLEESFQKLASGNTPDRASSKRSRNLSKRMRPSLMT